MDPVDPVLTPALPWWVTSLCFEKKSFNFFLCVLVLEATHVVCLHLLRLLRDEEERSPEDKMKGNKKIVVSLETGQKKPRRYSIGYSV